MEPTKNRPKNFWILGRHEFHNEPNQLRWDALGAPKGSVDFLNGVTTVCANGSQGLGCAIHVYAFTKSMDSTYFYNADGEMLFVVQEGTHIFKTEMGVLEVVPKEICVIPRGIKSK